MLNLLHVAVLFLNSIISRQIVCVLWHLDLSCIYLELNNLMLDFSMYVLELNNFLLKFSMYISGILIISYN